MRKLLWEFRNKDPVTSGPMNTTETPTVPNPTPNFQDASEDENSSLDLGENLGKLSSTNDSATEKSIVQDDVKLVAPPLTNVTSSMIKPGSKQEIVENNSAILPPQNPNSDSGDEETGSVLAPIASKDDHHLVKNNNSTFSKINTIKDDVTSFNKTKTDIIRPKRPFKNSISSGPTAFKPSTINGFSNFSNTSLAPIATPKPGIEDLSPKPPTQVSVKLKSYFL